MTDNGHDPWVRNLAGCLRGGDAARGARVSFNEREPRGPINAVWFKWTSGFVCMTRRWLRRRSPVRSAAPFKTNWHRNEIIIPSMRSNIFPRNEKTRIIPRITFSITNIIDIYFHIFCCAIFNAWRVFDCASPFLSLSEVIFTKLNVRNKRFIYLS